MRIIVVNHALLLYGKLDINNTNGPDSWFAGAYAAN